MKIAFITTAFNGMAQRLWIDLDRLNHEVYIVIASDEQQMITEIERYQPEIIIAPFLTTKIPQKIWSKYVCLIVHPGIMGDRGASSLDWAILNNKKKWGVTVLQAVEKMDAGAVWSFQEFEMRDVSKGELYRNEVTQAAAKGVLAALTHFTQVGFSPIPLDYSNPLFSGKWRNKTTQNDFAFSWNDASSEIIRKIRAADSTPGVQVKLDGNVYFAYGAHLELGLSGKAGQLIAKRNQAVCVATSDTAIWITHLKKTSEKSIKLPSTLVLEADQIPLSYLSPFAKPKTETWQEIRFQQDGDVGYLYFDFYNGAMSTEQCNRLRAAIVEAKHHVKLLVLMGGVDVWSNGIHLNIIENATNSAQEAWKNIQAIDDLILEIIQSTEHYIISALQGNAGAGGVSLALAADKVIARNGIVLNPHTKNMGLYGSEYWTYLLPKRIGVEKANKFTEECLPWGVAVSKEIGLIDDYYGTTTIEFVDYVKKQAKEIINLSYFEKLLKAKQFQRRKDERNKPLEAYRTEELAKMYKNFYENDMNFEKYRHDFVHKIPEKDARNVKNLYRCRREIYRKRKWESKDYKAGYSSQKSLEKK